MKRNLCTIALAVLCVAALLLAAWPAQAGEKGSYRGKALLYHIKFSQHKAIGEHPGGSVMMGEDDGVIFNDQGKDFLNNARYQVVWTADGTGAVTGCFKTFTMPDGSRLFAQCFGTLDDKGAGGTLKVVGGTGRFAGIRGEGKWRVTNVAEAVIWDLLEWNYEIP